MDQSNEEQASLAAAPDADAATGEATTATPSAGDRNETLPSPATRRLERASEGRLIAGVASGLAEYLNIDTSLVRVAFVVLSLFGGIGLVLGRQGGY